MNSAENRHSRGVAVETQFTGVEFLASAGAARRRPGPVRAGWLEDKGRDSVLCAAKGKLSAISKDGALTQLVGL
jgi:hypothetical protein